MADFQSLLSPTRNHFLAALSTADYERLAPHLAFVEMPPGQIVCGSDARTQYVLFPIAGMVSLISLNQNGDPAEIAVTGKEGIVGISLFMGEETISSRTVVQSALHAYRLPASDLMQEFGRSGHLRRLLLRFTHGLFTQIAQTAVCNRHHSLLQRFCRGLLLRIDRLPENELQITWELIANMMDVPPERVTGAARRLQSEGLIRYHRDHITVLDRSGLDKRVCECYAVVKGESDRLLHQVVKETLVG